MGDSKPDRDWRLVVIDRIWDKDLKGADCAARAVAMAVFRYCSEAGSTWTSIHTIARIAGVSTSTARLRLAVMVAHGGLTRQDRRDGEAQTSPIWRIVDADKFIESLKAPLPRRRRDGVVREGPGSENDHPGSDAEGGWVRRGGGVGNVGPTGGSRRIHDPGSVTRGDGTGEIDPGSDPETLRARATPTSDSGDEEAANLDRAWLALAAALPSSRPRTRTEQRLGPLRARLREHGIDAVLRTFRWIETSQHSRAVFLRDRGDVKTPLRPENFVTYLEFSAEPEVPPRALAVVDLWRALTGPTALVASPSLAAPVLVALDAVGEPAVLAVIRWVLTGTDEKARFLRDHRVVSLAGILSPAKLHGRVALAADAAASLPGPAVVTTGPDGAPLGDLDLGPMAAFRSPVLTPRLPILH